MSFLKKILEKLPLNDAKALYTSLGEILFHTLPRSEQGRLHWENQNKGRAPHTSPWTPSQGDVLLYKKIISCFLKSRGGTFRFLLLGVTPELRALLSGLHVFYVVADQSATMFERMSAHLSRGITETEIWVRAPWLSLPLPDHYFDGIIGDLVLFQFLPEEQGGFLSEIKRLLAPAGVFVSRIHFVPNGIARKNPITVIKTLLSSEVDEITISNRIMAALLDVCGDMGTGRTGRIKALEEIKKYLPRTTREERILRQTREDWSRSFFDYALQSQDNLKVLLNKHFSYTALYCSNDYPESDFYPIVYTHD